MKKKRILKVTSLITAIIAVLFLLEINFFNIWDNDRLRLHFFYKEPKNSLDVVFMGASENYTAVFPGQFYEETGLTSYVYAIAANPVTLWEYDLKEILKRQKPSLLVVEINGALYDEDELYGDAPIRSFTESIPWSRNKIDALCSYHLKDAPITYYLPFIKYHSNLDGKFTLHSIQKAGNINLTRFRPYSVTKQLATLPKVFEPDAGYLDPDTGKEQELAPTAEKKLRGFLNLCRENQIEVFFYRAPHYIEDKNKKRALLFLERSNTVGRIVQEEGYRFLNCETLFDRIGIDRENDFYNKEHLNVYGQKKFTSFIGDYIRENYELQPVQQTEKREKNWKRTAEYTRYMQEYAVDQIKAGSKRYVYETVYSMTKLKKYMK